MPTLIDLLDQYLFSNAPGLVARAAIQRAWEYTTANSWDKLYLASLEDALSEELPHLSAYSGPNTTRPTRPELAHVLAADLGEAGTTLATLDQSSRAFLTELARAMQSQRLITINNHNLFTDEYRQILLNLFDHAHTRFKSVLTRSEPAYSAALGTATDHDPILLASISNYLARQFGVTLDTLNQSLPPQPPVRVTGPLADELDFVEIASAPSTAFTTETLQEDVSLEPLTELNLPSEPDNTEAVPPPQAPENYPVAWESTNEFAPSQGSEGVTASLQAVSSEQAALEMQAESSESAAPTSGQEEPPAPPQPPVWPLEAANPIPRNVIASNAQGSPAAAALSGMTLEAIARNLETQTESLPAGPALDSRNMPSRLRVLVATPGDVQTERRLLSELIRELDSRARTRFGLELVLVNPNPAALSEGQSPVEQADIFVGVIWLQFGAESVVTNETGERFFAGSRTDFARALELGSGRTESWLRTVIYRSIRPPLDLLHMNVAEYSRVQQFFERAGAYAGDDLVRVYADPSELINDARARLDAWIYNYAGDLAGALTEYGNNSAANGQIADSLADYNRAISLYRELDRPEQELALWLQVGALQQSTNNTAATEAFDTALRLARRIEDDPAAARALRSLGALDAANGSWQSALEKYREAGTYLQPDDQDYRALLTDQLDAHEALGDQARARSESTSAEREFESALAIAEALDESGRQASLWNKLGALAAEHGEWDDSLKAYDNALALSGAEPRQAHLAILNAQANAHTQLALKARSRGDFEAAEHAYQSALRVNAQGRGDRQQRVALFTALGLLATDRAEWERGIEANEQALALLDSPDDIETRRALMASQAKAYYELGAKRAESGELAAASSAYRDALSLFQELDATADQGAALYHLGAISAQQDEWSEANAYLTEALPRLEGPSNAELREQTLKSQANALQQMGDDRRSSNDWGQAEIAYVQARSNLEQLGLRDNTGPLLYRLGVVTAAQSRLPEALAYFQQARTRLGGEANAETRVASLRAQSETLHRFADMYRGAGDFQSAQGHYRQQLELAEELQDDALEANAYHSLGLVAADQSEWDNAIDFYDTALARLQSPEHDADRIFVQRHQLVAFEKIGDRERAAHQLPQAELAYRSGLTLAQTLGEKESEADLLYTLGLLAIEHENWDEALVDLRRALGIYNLMPSAPNKPKVIFAIGRAQRGQKQAHLRSTIERAETARDAALYLSAIELARELGDAHSGAVASQELGNLASENADWDKALVHYDEALVGLSGSDDAPRRESILRAQLEARRERSAIAQSNAQWGAADADLFVALDLARELKDSNTQGDLVYRRGQVAAGQARWNEAIDLYSEALNRLDENNPERATVEQAQAVAYQSLGDAERESQNWPGVEAAYIQSLALRQTLNESAPQAELFASLGDVAMRQGRWNDAIRQLQSAQMIETGLGQAERAAELETQISLAARALKRQEQETIEQRGDAFRASRAYALARTEYEGALELAEELDDRTAQAELHAKLGFIAAETAALEDALGHYRVAAGMYDAPENAAQRNALVELQAQALQEMGNRAGHNAAWSEAFGFYSQAVALLDSPSQEIHRNEVVQLQAVTSQNLGDQHQSAGEWDKALDQFRRAAGLYANVGAVQEGRVVREREAEVLTEQARVAQQSGDFATAQTLYAESISHFGELQAAAKVLLARAEQLASFRAAGNAAADVEDFAAARRQYRQALGIAEELNDHRAQAELYHRLGQLAARQSDWSGALLSYQYALERTGEQSELGRIVLADQMTAHKELGTSHRIAGDLDAAEASYVRAYTNAELLDRSASASELAFLLGTLSADRENWESALGYYDQALASLSPADAERNEIQPYRAFAYQQLGDTQRANGQFAAAASAYVNATNIADELGDQARQGQLLHRFGLLEAAQGRWEPALDAYDRAESRIGSSDPETFALLQRDSSFAAQALKREHLTAQLDHASAARGERAWDDAATAYRSAMALAIDLNETELRDSIRRDLVALYAEKAYALGSDEWWDESRDANRESMQLAQEYGFTDDVGQRQVDLLALVSASAANAKKLEENQDWDASQQAYNRTLRFAQEFGDLNAEGTSLLGLGSIAQLRTQWQESKAYYEQARPLLVQVENAGALMTLDASLARVQDVLDRQAQQANALAEAELAQSQGRFDDAQIQYRTAFGLAHGLGDTPSATAIAAALVAASAAKAISLREKGDWAASERAYRDALGVAREFDDTAAVNARRSDLVALTRERAENLRTLESPLATEEAYRHALDVAQEFDDPDASVALKSTLVALAGEQAVAARSGADQATTERSYRRAIEVAQEFDQVDVARARQSELITLTAAHAETLRTNENWVESENAYRHALEVAQEFDDREAVRARKLDLIALATARAKALRVSENWQESENAYRHALLLAQEFDDRAAVNARQNDLIALATARAEEFRRDHDFVASDTAYRHALELAQEFQDPDAVKERKRELILLAASRAQTHQTGNDFRARESAYRDALAVAQEFEDTDAIQSGHAQIIALAVAQTALHKEKQDREQVTLAAQHQLDIAQEFGLLEAQADALYALGENARSVDDLPTARNYFLTAAQTYEQAEAHQGAAQAQQALQQVETILGHQARLQTSLSNAATARASGRAAEAEQAYRDALVETDALNDVPTRAAALAALGALAFDLGQWQKSLDNYAAAAPLYEKLEQPQRVAELAQEQARATRRLRMAQRDDARMRGDQALQAANLSQASKAYQEGLALAQELDDTAGSGAFEMSLGQIATAEQNLDDAAQWYDAAALSFAQAQDETQRTTARTQLLATYTALGDKHSDAGDWEPAHNNYERAVQLADEIAPAPQQAHLLARLGLVAAEQNKLRDSIGYLDRALETLGANDLTNQRGSILGERAQVWQKLGDSEMDSENLSAAEFAYDHALADARMLQDDLQTAQILNSLGLVRGARGEWSSALHAHQESYSLLETVDVPSAKLTILTSLAEAKSRVGETDAARRDYQNALELAHNLSDTQQIAEIEFALGEIATGKEHWQEALTHYDAARPGFVELDDTAHLAELDAHEATAFAHLGEILYGEGQWIESQIAFTRALELDSATGRTDRDGVLFYRRGNAAAAQSNFAEAIADYDRASGALTDDDVELRNRTLAQLAFALQQQGKRAADAGDLSLAETAFTRALKMAQASDNFEQVADLWFRLGIMYRSQARHDEALSAFRRAYEFDRLDGNAILQTVVADALAARLLQRGQAALEAGSYAEADAELDEALDFARQAENPQLVGSTLEALGNSADAQGDTSAAIDYLSGAGKTFAAIEDMERWRVVSQKQAALLRRSAAAQLAVNEFADAENLYRRTTLLQQAAGDTSYQAENHLGLGRALLAQERFADALDEFEQADATFAPGSAERTELMKVFAEALEAHGARAIAESNLARAEDDLKRAAGYRDELGQRARAGLDWQQLANIASQKNDFVNAVNANEQALARLDAPETAETRKAVLHQQAKILASIGNQQKQAADWNAASETYRHALAIVQEQGDLEMMAQLRLLLGSLAVAQEHWDEAQTEYTHALDVYDELNHPAAQAATWTQLGDMHRQSTQYDHATEAFERARELYKQIGNHRQVGAMWVRLGHVEGDRAEWDKALDQYQTALHLYNDIGARSAKPEVYRAFERAVRNAKLVAADETAAQGDTELADKAFGAAEESYREALALYQEADEPVLQAQMHNQLGVALESRENSDDALAEYRAALGGFERVGISEAQVGVLNNIGGVERQRQNWNNAEASYRQALALIDPSSDLARAAELYNSLGVVREAQGDWESAYDHYHEAVATYQKLGLDQARIESEANMARARRGAQERAEQEQLARLQQARAEGDLAEAGEILNSLGLLAAEDGRWSTALDYYREAVTNFELLAAESDPENVWRIAQGTVLNNIGDASQQIGAWNDADYAYSRALGLAHEIGDRESEAIILANLGVAAQAQSQLPRALDFNLRALKSYTELGDETPRADLLERVGDLQLQLDQRPAAEASYRQALALARQGNESERIGRLLKQLGLLVEGRGSVAEALEYYKEGLTRSIELEHASEQQELLLRQGALYLRSGQVDEAERAHRAALVLATEHGDEATQATLHTRLGESAIARSDWQAAIREYQSALALNEKFESADEQLRDWMQIGDAHAALEQPVQADEAYSNALDLAARVENADLRTLWLARAGIAEKQNRWQDASEYLERALAVPDPTGNAGAQVNLLFRRGDAAMHAHNWSVADKSINDGMELANASDLAVLYGWGMNRLGLLSQAQRNWSDALENFQEAIEIFRVNEQPLGEALVLNNIARLKLESNDTNQADLFAQAALAIAQAFGSNREASYSLYTRGLASLEAQELEPALRFLNQAIATDPENWAAQLQLGNSLLANDNITEATQQAEAGLGQFPDWELGAQTQLTIASLYHDDNRPFKANLKRTRALLRTATERRNVSQEMLDAVESILRAVEGHAESALEELNAAASKPALSIALEARRFVKTALWALSKSPRRVKGKQVLMNYFSGPKVPSRKGKRRGGAPSPQAIEPPTTTDATRTDESPGATSEIPDKSTE